MVVGWGALIMAQLANIPMLAKSRIVFAGSELLPWLGPAELGGLVAAQVAVMVAATAAGLWTLRQIRLAASEMRRTPSRLRWTLVQAFFLAVAVAAVFLVI
jgi:hypothetical protein